MRRILIAFAVLAVVPPVAACDESSSIDQAADENVVVPEETTPCGAPAEQPCP